MEKEINVEEIMEEIRKNIKERGYQEEPVSFEEIPIPEQSVQNNANFSYEEFMSGLGYLNLNWNNNFQIPITGKNPIVNLIKKVIVKCSRFIVVPIVCFQNAFNVNSVRCMLQMKEYMEDTNYYKQRIAQLETEMESRNEQITLLEKSLETYKNEIMSQAESRRKRITLLENKVSLLKKEMDYLGRRLNIRCDLDPLESPEIDYFEFENKMRGSRDSVKISQQSYVPYFHINGGGVILDIGCGRGEFLELMYDHGIAAKGIDVYPPFVLYCQERGFDVQQIDALTYLGQIENATIGGIFMGQVAEHLNREYLVALIRLAYLKLKPGCYFILETPNPESLSTYRNFWLDSQHYTPVHYLYLKEVFSQIGFESIERFDNPFSLYPYKLEELHTEEQITNLEKFNAGIRAANELIFGYRDYTLIARK